MSFSTTTKTKNVETCCLAVGFLKVEGLNNGEMAKSKRITGCMGNFYQCSIDKVKDFRMFMSVFSVSITEGT